MPWLRLSILTATVVLAVSNVGCPFRKTEMRPIGPEVKADLVIYFKTGVTHDQIEKFWEEVLSTADPSGKGYFHKPGVGEISRVYPSVQGHEAIAVSFFPSATNEKREAIKRDIRSAPIVYKILENIAPADVRKIE